MRLPKVKNFDSLTADQQYEYKMQALADGKISDIYAIDQVSSLYRQQQLSKLGLNPNLSYEQANTMLSFNKLNQLARDNQLGMEVKPLMDLYGQNPELASKLAEQLFSSGYLTANEINKRAETPLSESGYEGGQGWNTFYKAAGDFLGKIPFAGGANKAILGKIHELDEDKKSLKDYDSKAFKYYYDQVQEEKEKASTGEVPEEDIYKEARKRYLLAQNKNIYKDIQTQIDNYYTSEVEAATPELEKAISQMSPEELVTQLYGKGAVSLLGAPDAKGRPITPFDIFAQGSDETIETADGSRTIHHPGSNYWREFKDTSVFDNFTDADKNKMMAKYLAYKGLFGEDKANQYLETAMQTYVANNRGWGKAIADVAGGIGTTAGLIIPEALVGIGGLGYDVLGAVLPDNYGGNWAKNQASIMLTGRDLQGREVSVPTWDNTDPLNWLGSRLNLGYLHKVSQYKNWDIEQIRKAEANGGVSKDAMYIVDPTEGTKWWQDGLDMLDMGGQAIGQMALAYLTSGASLEANAAATMGRAAAAMRVATEVATVTAPIASAYAVGAANEAYNNTVNSSREMAYNQAAEQFMQISQTEEYQKQRKEAVDKYFNQKGRVGLDGTVYPAPFDSPEARKQQEEYYDSQYIEDLANKLIGERSQKTSQIAQNSALLAYRTSASIEALKYGYTTAMFGSWKLSNNANKLLEQNLGVKTYGKLTQGTTGKFTREGIHPLGIKKLTLKTPNQIAAWKTAESAIVGGGVSNYTDDVTTGLAVGLSLGYSNSSLLREFDPQAYADTWYGDSEAARALHILGSGIQGANDMIRSGQPWHSFYIGVGGSFLGAGYRFRGKDQIRQQYAQQNAQYEAETGKKISKNTKFWQGVDTYTQTLWSTFTEAKRGVKELDQNIKVYNETLDKRKDALNEIASMRQGIIQRRHAQNQMSFSNATLQSDILATKLIAIQHSLESNPLRGLDKQKFNSEISELYDIANDNVSAEKKEDLIQSAYGAREQDKSKPLTQQRKDEIWEDIKANAKRFSEFSSDYYEAVDQFKHQDASFEDPSNWALLHQKSQIQAQAKRIQRDIDNLSNEIGITVDTQVTDRTQGELTEEGRQSSIKAAQEAIEALKKERQEAQKVIEELSQKESLTKEEGEQLTKQEVLSTKADRAIPRLEAEIDNLEKGSSIARAESGLTTNVIQLHNMLSRPGLYTKEQQAEINKVKTKIGEKGELYVEEMAMMQDQLNEMNDAQESLDANPRAFQVLVAGLQDVRESMGQKAIYKAQLQTRFNYLKGLPKEELGSSSAVALDSKQFDQFIKENPELAESLTPYKQMNTAVSNIFSLLKEYSQSGTVDEATKRDILTNVQSLGLQDSEYLLNNGDQGVVDMLEFLKSISTQNPAKVKALNDLITDFKRISSIEQSTTAYSEYKVKQLYERSKEEADQLVETLKKAQQQEQKEALEQEETEEIPDMASMENETEEAIDLEGAEGGKAQTEPEKKPVQEAPEAAEAPAETSAEGLPEGVTRNSEGNIETMSIEQQAEQLGLTEAKADSMIDDSAPVAQETTEQQEEVHGCFFNPYESQALKAGELVPFTDSHVYNWLSKEGVNLGAIIDDELSHILKVNPKVQLMQVKRAGDDYNVSSNIFLVVEYTDKVAKHHLPENGGVITSNGKQYLIVGTMWNTKSQDGTEAANLMQTTRNNLQKKGVEFFDSNPNERFYVDPVMNTEVTTFNSGHIVNTVNGETSTHTISELLDEYNRTHAKADQMEITDLGFGVITMKEGFYTVGPIDVAKAKKHKPQRYSNPNKYGQVYVLVPAANGEIVPIFINPIVLSEMKDGQLKTQIDTQIIPQLLSENYHDREQAISNLCQILCITGSITNPDGKGVLIGKENIPTVSLVNGKSVISTYQLRDGRIYKDGQEVTKEHFKKDLYQLNPRVNLSLSGLDTQTNLQAFLRYEEAGALTTDAAKLGTFGGKYYVAPINPATGQPMRTEQKAQPVEVSSDYSKASATPVMLPVGGQTYVFRNGKWVNQKDGKAVTDNAELTQIAWAQKVQNGEASLALRQGSYDYYIAGIETSNPVVVAYNTKTRSYERVVQAFADQIVAERRAELERNRADAEAKKQLESRQPVEEAPETSQPSESPQARQSGYNIDDVLNSILKLAEENKEVHPNLPSSVRSAIGMSASVPLIVSKVKQLNSVISKDQFTDDDIAKIDSLLDDIYGALNSLIAAHNGGKNSNIAETAVAKLAREVAQIVGKQLEGYPNRRLEVVKKLATKQGRSAELNRSNYDQYKLYIDGEFLWLASYYNTQSSPAKQKNDFELKQSKKQDKQSIESMLDNFSDEAVMEQVDKIYSIVEAKIADAKAGKLDQAHTEKWINFDTSNLQSELERIGIQTDNIEDVESWIDNLENCE